MVNWFTIISTIIGSGLTIVVFNLVLDNFILIPSISIVEELNERLNENQITIKINNSGSRIATNLVLTFEGVNLTALSTLEMFDNNNIIKVDDTRQNDQGILQLSIPRLVPGTGSVLSINLPNRPEKVYLTYDQGSSIWPMPDDTPVYPVSDLKLVLILSLLAVASFASSFVWRLIRNLFRQYQRAAIAKSASDIERVARELQEFPYLTKRYWWKYTKCVITDTPKWGKVSFSQQKIYYRRRWLSNLARSEVIHYQFLDEDENVIKWKNKEGQEFIGQNITPPPKKGRAWRIQKKIGWNLGNPENRGALYSTQKWDWKSRLIIKAMVDSDAELFKEFYGKLLARDQTIGKIIDERFMKSKNPNEIDNDSLRKNRFDIDMKQSLLLSAIFTTMYLRKLTP